MEELPPELTQIICSNLTPKDLKSVRLTSKHLAASGACYILPRVFLFNCKKSFDELKEIAQHPIFSKHVTTLIYDHTSLGCFDDFVCWNKARPNPCYIPRWVDFEPYQKTTEGAIDSRSDRAMRRARTLFRQACDRCPEEPAAVKRLWDLHQTLADEQWSEGLREIRLETMKLAFSLFPKLNHVILEDNQHALSKNRIRLFTGLPILHDDPEPDMHAVLDDVWSASAFAGRSMRHLTIPILTFVGAHRRLFKETFSPEMIAEKMQGIIICTLTVHSPVWSLKHASISRQRVSGLLQSASKLEVLNIQIASGPLKYSARNIVYNHQDEAGIHYIIKDAQWPALHTITLSGCYGIEDVLVSFLLRHKQRLRRVAFKHCQLSVGNWTSLFTRIAGRLSDLEQVILAGYLISNSVIEFHLPFRGNLTTSLASDLQTFIVEGGSFPPIPSLEESAVLPTNIAQERFDDDKEEY